MAAEEPRAGDATPAGTLKKIEGPITVEQPFNVDGRRLVVKVTFPGPISAEIGMEAALVAANRCLVSVESKTHKIEKPRSGA